MSRPYGCSNLVDSTDKTSERARWLNGESPPPRKAACKLAGRLLEEEIQCARLVGLWDAAFASAALRAAPMTNQCQGNCGPGSSPTSAPQFTGRAAHLQTLAGWADPVGASNAPWSS